LVERLTGQMPLEMVDYIIKNKAVFSLAQKYHNQEHLTKDRSSIWINLKRR
jgi:hypothetical protein